MSSGHIQPNLFKADVSFFRAYKQHRSQYRKDLIIHLFEIVMFAIIIPIDYTILQVGNKMGIALAIGAADSLISFLILICVYFVFFVRQKTQNYYSLAKSTYHTTTQPIQSLQNIEECTSSTVLYAANGVQVTGLNEQVIKAYSNLARQQIVQCLQYKYPRINCTLKIYNFLSLLSMLLIIIQMSISSSLNAAQITVLIVFLVLEAYIKLMIMLVLLFIALSPILFVLFLCYVCCCKPKEGQEMVLDLKAKSAGVDEVVKSGGQCSICLMDIKVTQMVYQLQCSDKHIFHEGCLSKWSKVKPNCPSCRKELPLVQPPPQS